MKMNRLVKRCYPLRGTSQKGQWEPLGLSKAKSQREIQRKLGGDYALLHGKKTPVPEPRVDKGKQPERRPDPLRTVPAESSTRRGDPVIRIPEDGQTVVGLLRILKEELLKELRGDLSDLRGGVEAVRQGQVVTESFGRRLSNRVTAVTEEIHGDMENLFGSMDALSSDLRGLRQGSYERRERTCSSHFYGRGQEPIPDPDAYDWEDANWEPPQPPMTQGNLHLGRMSILARDLKKEGRHRLMPVGE
jgi:hypothetical protein